MYSIFVYFYVICFVLFLSTSFPISFFFFCDFAIMFICKLWFKNFKKTTYLSNHYCLSLLFFSVWAFWSFFHLLYTKCFMHVCMFVLMCAYVYVYMLVCSLLFLYSVHTHRFILFSISVYDLLSVTFKSLACTWSIHYTNRYWIYIYYRYRHIMYMIYNNSIYCLQKTKKKKYFNICSYTTISIFFFCFFAVLLDCIIEYLFFVFFKCVYDIMYDTWYVYMYRFMCTYTPFRYNTINCMTWNFTLYMFWWICGHTS